MVPALLPVDRMRIMPGRTGNDVIGGVVITFADITGDKRVEAELRKKIAALEGLNESTG